MRKILIVILVLWSDGIQTVVCGNAMMGSVVDKLLLLNQRGDLRAILSRVCLDKHDVA